jgi:hypothetical protein
MTTRQFTGRERAIRSRGKARPDATVPQPPPPPELRKLISHILGPLPRNGFGNYFYDWLDRPSAKALSKRASLLSREVRPLHLSQHQMDRITQALPQALHAEQEAWLKIAIERAYKVQNKDCSTSNHDARMASLDQQPTERGH